MNGKAPQDLSTDLHLVNDVERVEYYVHFDSAPAITGREKQAVAEEHAAFHAHGREVGLRYSTHDSFHHTWNGLVVSYDPADHSKEEFHRLVQAHKNVRAITRVGLIEPMKETMDTTYDSSSVMGNVRSALEMVQADVAQEQGKIGDGVLICLIDSGIDMSHPALAGKIVSKKDFVDGDDTPDDCAGHGTHVAGIVAGVADEFRGIAPGASLGVYRVFNCSGAIPSYIVLQGLERAIADSCNIINLSLGQVYNWDPNEPLVKALETAAAAGHIITKSVGNQGNLMSVGGSFNAFSLSDSTSGILDWMAVGSVDNKKTVTQAFQYKKLQGSTEAVTRSVRGTVVPKSGSFRVTRVTDPCNAGGVSLTNQIAFIATPTDLLLCSNPRLGAVVSRGAKAVYLSTTAAVTAIALSSSTYTIPIFGGAGENVQYIEYIQYTGADVKVKIYNEEFQDGLVPYYFAADAPAPPMDDATKLYFALYGGSFTAVSFQACGALSGTPLQDKAALVGLGGSCSLSQKATNAFAAGAKAVIFVSTKEAFVPRLLSPVTGGPVLSVSFAFGSQINDDLTSFSFSRQPSLLWSSAPGYVNLPSGGYISPFSSRGLTPNLNLKPSVVAPGGFIISTYINGGYKVISGTSMAAPAVAGALAVLVAEHPTASKEKLFTALLNGASIVDYDADTYPGIADSPSAQGAGQIQIMNSLGALEAGLSISPPIVNIAANALPYTFTLQITNNADTDVTFEISQRKSFVVDGVIDAVYTIYNSTAVLSATSITVGAYGVELVSVTILSMPECNLDLPVYGGYIVFTGPITLSVPYSGYLRDPLKIPLFGKTVCTDINVCGPKLTLLATCPVQQHVNFNVNFYSRRVRAKLLNSTGALVGMIGQWDYLERTDDNSKGYLVPFITSVLAPKDPIAVVFDFNSSEWFTSTVPRGFYNIQMEFWLPLANLNSAPQKTWTSPAFQVNAENCTTPDGGSGDPPNPEDPDGPTPDGNVFGDPHYRTFDGMFVTYTGCGNQLLTSDPKTGLSIQARHCLRGGQAASSTCGVAIKCEAESETIEMYAMPAGIRFFVGGKEWSPHKSASYDTKSYQITMTEGKTSIQCQDSVKLSVYTRLASGEHYFDASVSLTPSFYKKDIKGLLGSWDGIMENDVTYSSGAIWSQGHGMDYVNAVEHPTLNDVQDSWTIADGAPESLFTLTEAENDASCAVQKTRRHVLSARVEAEGSFGEALHACHSLGVTREGPLLQACLFDYIASNKDMEFMENHMLAQAQFFGSTSR